MLKWIDIVFKSNCMLPGTLSDFAKLSLKIINRYLSKLSNGDFVPASFNRLIEQNQKVGELVAQKIL